MSDAESAAWCGAAEAARALLAEAARRGTTSSYANNTSLPSTGKEPTYTSADQFRREPKVATRLALRNAGCVVERWAPAAAGNDNKAALDRTRRIGGAWGGSGL